MDGAPARRDVAHSEHPQRLREIADYYDRATDDYRHWSTALHMHFGCWRWPLSPFDRAAMVEQLSVDVIERLLSGPSREGANDPATTVADLGCGVGTTARQLARLHPTARVIGLSLSARQVEWGNRLSADAALRERVELRVGDYCETALASASLAGAYAIESSCYDPNHGAGLIREAARVLEPGGRLIIADAFRRHRPMPRPARALERRMAAGWQLPQLGELERFTASLTEHGFDFVVEDISLRVAPSAMQIPLVALGFRLREGFGLAAHRDATARAPLWGMLCGLLFPRRFGYYLISATRRRITDR